MEVLKRLIFNRRHLKLNIIITSQSYVNLPLDLRKNISNLILFKPSKREFQLVFDELIETKKELFQDVMKISYDEPHNFLFLNINSQRMFKNWDELIFNEDESDSVLTPRGRDQAVNSTTQNLLNWLLKKIGEDLKRYILYQLK